MAAREPTAGEADTALLDGALTALGAASGAASTGRAEGAALASGGDGGSSTMGPLLADAAIGATSA